MRGKHPGRVGDSPLPGAGLYAGKLPNYLLTLSILIANYPYYYYYYYFFFYPLLLTKRLTWHLVQKLQGHVTNKKRKKTKKENNDVFGRWKHSRSQRH